jgi:hypothetical protein
MAVSTQLLMVDWMDNWHSSWDCGVGGGQRHDTMTLHAFLQAAAAGVYANRLKFRWQAVP